MNVSREDLAAVVANGVIYAVFTGTLVVSAERLDAYPIVLPLVVAGVVTAVVATLLEGWLA